MGETQMAGGQWSHHTQAMLMRTPPPPNHSDMDLDEIQRDVDMEADDINTNPIANGTQKFKFPPLVRYIRSPSRKRERVPSVYDVAPQDKRQRLRYGGEDPGNDSQVEFPHAYAAASDASDFQFDKMDQAPDCADAPEKTSEQQDPRESFPLLKRSKTFSGRSRRKDSVRLPFETAPAFSRNLDLRIAIQVWLEAPFQWSDVRARFMDSWTSSELEMIVEDTELITTDDTMGLDQLLGVTRVSATGTNMVDMEYTIKDRVKGKGRAA